MPPQDERWVVAHGDASKKQHRVLVEQLLTRQAAKCGFSPDRGSWMLSDTPDTNWAQLPKCKSCSKEKAK